MFRGCTFEEQQVNSKNDGGLYREVFRKDGILWGCEMTTTNDSFTMQPGELIISGRVIWVDGATQIPFTGPIQNGYGQIILTIDLSKTATKEEFDQVEASVVYSTTSLFPELTQGEINTSNGDMVYQQELAVVSIAGGNITGITRQIGGAEIDAEKLGGQPPEYYARRGGEAFTGEVSAPRFASAQLGFAGTVQVSSGSHNDAIYLKGNSIQCTNFEGTLLALLNCGAITVSGGVSCGGNVSCSGVEAVTGIAISTPGVPAIHAWNTSNWLAIRCNGGVAARDANDTAYTQMVAGAFNQQSSERFKDILAEMTLEQARKALDIELIKFKYKEKYNDDGGKIHYGVKAEQLDELGLTDLVSYDQEGLPFSVDYSKLTPYLNGIVKDHDKRIERLEAKAAKYDALSALLVKKGVLTQEEIDGLEV